MAAFPLPLPTRLGTLDYYRHAAATAVVYSHAYVLSGNEANDIFGWTGHFDTAAVAVNFFFALSGYLMFGAVQRSPAWIPFARNRLARLLPGLMVCVLVTTLILGPVETSFEIGEYARARDTLRYLGNMAFLFSPSLPGVFSENPYPDVVNGSLWTLAYEAFCYAAISLTIVVGSRARVHLAIVAAAACLLFLAVSTLPEPNRYANVARLLASFALGTIAAHGRKARIWILITLFVITVLSSPGPGLGGRVGAHAAVAIVCIACFEVAQLLARIVKPLPFDFSFGIYIYSFPIQQLLVQWVPEISPLSFFALSMLATLPVAAFSWYAVERPLLQKSKGLSRWQMSNAASHTA